MYAKVKTENGAPIADVAIKISGRPTYITNDDGFFYFAADNNQFTIERIEKTGYKLISPKLPYTATTDINTLTIIMTLDEKPQQTSLREYGQKLKDNALQLESQRMYGDAADSLIKRANLDTENVRWQIETGMYMHKYGDYRTAQTFYNRAIKKAQELYGDNNQWLAECYNLYGDNYFVWDPWGASGMTSSAMHFADAKTYYNYARSCWISLLGEQCNAVANSYLYIGRCWRKLENDTMAMQCYEKALDILKSLPNPDRNIESAVYVGQTHIYFNRNDYASALSMLEKSLAIQKELYGENSENYQAVMQQIDKLKKIANQ
ncbi:MAG: tetratricopeptide repeat protein [Bacteroidales bacterium]|nr:tetratricopeptide repeat protein [Bacteroidales bacterium]